MSSLLWFIIQLHRQWQQNKQAVGTGVEVIRDEERGWKHLALPV